MMQTRTHNLPTAHRQNGAVLFIALILLLAMTLIGVTAMQSTTLQERMAGNMRDQNLAFQAAEAALLGCEQFLGDAAVLPGFSAANGLYQSADYSSGAPPVWTTIDWDPAANESREYGVDGTPEIANVAADPRCIIEELPPIIVPGGSLASDTAAKAVMYRITARAQGGSPETITILQTTYRR